MITSTSNPRIKWVRALQARRKTRWEERCFIMEGNRLAAEIVAAEVPVRLVLHTDHLGEKERGLVNNLARLGGEVALVSDSVMAACSDTESPQGLLMVLPFPEIPVPPSPNFVLVIDQIADPGNLGTLLRTALAAGVEVVYLLQGSVDPFNPKVVRGGMGAHLRLPIRLVEVEELEDILAGLQVWVAEADSGVPYYEVDWSQPIGLVVGSEASGTQPSLRTLTGNRVHVPMPGGSESLNAAIAAAVMLFEIVRQREIL